MWGVLYVVMLAFVGQLWLSRWGALVVLASVGACLAWIGFRDPVLFHRAAHMLTSSPAALMQDILVGTIGRGRSAGGGLIGCGLALMLLLRPAFLETLQAKRSLVKVNALKRTLGTTVAMLVLGKSARVTPRAFFSSLLMLAMNVGMPIAIWTALRRMKAEGISTAFASAKLPDLAVPHFHPVWHVAYFVLPLAVVFTVLLYLPVYRKWNIADPVFHSQPALLLGLPILGLFVPAGISLFVWCQCVVKALFIFIEALNEVKAPEHVPDEEQPEKPEEPALAGTLLLQGRAPVLDLAMTGDDTCWVLGQDKSLRRLDGQSVGSLSSLTLEEPRGLARLPEGKCAVVDGVGKVSILSMGWPPTIHELRTSSPIICYALNPFGSMVAFTCSHDRGPLSMLSTQTLKEQLLLADPGQVTTIVFSADGRHLGIGCVGGIVKILDMSTRRVSVTLYNPEGQHEIVTVLNAGPEGRWVVAYGNGEVVCWSRNGGLLHSTRSTSRVESMATDLDHGRVAIGTESGFVHVLHPDLSEAIFAERVHTSGVVRLAFITNGSAFISASADGSVRRVSFRS